MFENTLRRATESSFELHIYHIIMSYELAVLALDMREISGLAGTQESGCFIKLCHNSYEAIQIPFLDQQNWGRPLQNYHL